MMDLLPTLTETVLLLFFFAAALIDLRTSRLSIWFLISGLVAGLLLLFLSERFTVKGFLFALIPGTALFLIALLTKQAVGYGDCLLLLITGIFLGPERTILQFFISLLLAGGFSILLLVLQKKGRRENLPFAPFLLAGYVGVLIIS